jgi:hypothetical protein
MDLTRIAEILDTVSSDPHAAYNGTMEQAQEELAQMGQQLWFDNEETQRLYVGPLSTEAEADEEEAEPTELKG